MATFMDWGQNKAMSLICSKIKRFPGHIYIVFRWKWRKTLRLSRLQGDLVLYCVFQIMLGKFPKFESGSIENTFTK